MHIYMYNALARMGLTKHVYTKLLAVTMCRRRRKTFTLMTGSIFLLCIIQLNRIQKSSEVTRVYIKGDVASGHLDHKVDVNDHPSQDSSPLRNKTIRKVSSTVVKETPQQVKQRSDQTSSRRQTLKRVQTPPVDSFSPKLSSAEKLIAYNLLETLHEVMTSSNLTYWIYSGTLLGSFRHHDLIPWDDDIDILTDIVSKEKVIAELTKLAPKYTAYRAGSRLKFYVTSAEQTSNYMWTFPYIDISFYRENGTTLYDYSDNQDMGDLMFVYEKQSIFPLHLRPLGDLMVNSPRDGLANLRATYPNFSECRSPHYLHRNESVIGNGETKTCQELKDRFPFVHRKPSEQGIEETLKIGEEVIQTILVDEPNYAITDPYTLQVV